jgi:hypothetical protein
MMGDLNKIVKRKEGDIMNFTPWKYQTYAINHVMDHKASGLFLDMGMG